jgi:CRISPR-associated protein Csm1
MKKHELLDASTRVALAAYLHDLGKFAERAGIAEGDIKNAKGVTVKDINKQQYCPNFNGRYSHVHAAYTAIAMDVIEKHS